MKIQLARVYAPITRGERTDDGYRLTAYAFVNEAVATGPAISRSAMEEATAGYLQWANIREMHGSSAAGVCERAEWTPIGCEMDVLVVDPVAIEKCERGVYKGLSVGVRPLVVRGGKVEKCEWVETSLVDRPADPDAVFRLNRSEDAPEGDVVDVEIPDEEAGDEIALTEEQRAEVLRGAFTETMAKIEPRVLTSRAIDVLQDRLYDELLWNSATSEQRVTQMDEILAEFRAYILPFVQDAQRFIEAAAERSESSTVVSGTIEISDETIAKIVARLKDEAIEGIERARDEEFVGRRAVAESARPAPDPKFAPVARTFGGGVAGQIATTETSSHADAVEAARKAASEETNPVKRQEKVAEYSRLKSISPTAG